MRLYVTLAANVKLWFRVIIGTGKQLMLSLEALP
jgi:hypothetical protein